ncbi:MAG TPA: glycoside hydrolase family 99-like domain-containing protein [Ferruginibacter sp.]|nr:glycoside hydrolase family 99-like domain-containing protein [Ferruginibacter sp.]HMP21262.1 glycoside hydrolase family 99-like domain-containing protein [Ferruginibacter sp.]
MPFKPIAIHLPQFHPIPENDEWWGKGFTEWTNVAKAKPLFKGHYQPQLPADLGFYDLRLAETRAAQAAMAKQYGIYGFCYYHYWFHGKRLLQQPVDEIIRTGQPDFPFMLCWANGSWTRTWDGNEDILIEQTYSADDDAAHIQHLVTYFKDNRYIKIDNKPVLAVCRTEMLPDAAATAALWRNAVKAAGFDDLYLVKMEMFEAGVPPEKIGFDAAAEFQPDWRNFPPQQRKPWQRIANRLGLHTSSVYARHRLIDYAALAKKMLAKPVPSYKFFPGITPGWDNTPRKKKGGLILKDNTPEKFEYWLKEALQKYAPVSTNENFFFINAWNEWAEGNHLEPCTRWGTQYLEAVSRQFSQQQK